jgi:hypothetical protein
MLPQPPLCTSTVYFCFPSSSSSSCSSSSSSSSFFLPAPQRPNTCIRAQTRRNEEIDVSAREAQQTKERTRKKGTENTPAQTKNQERAATPSSSSFVDRHRPSAHCSPFCRLLLLLLLLRVRRRILSNVVVEIDLLSCITKICRKK